jgi:hypothetical protein
VVAPAPRNSATAANHCDSIIMLAGYNGGGGFGHLAASYWSGAGWTSTRLPGVTPSGTNIIFRGDGKGVGLVRNATGDTLQYTVWAGGSWSALTDIGVGITTQGKPSLASTGNTARAVFHGFDFNHYTLSFAATRSGTTLLDAGASPAVMVSRGTDATVAFMQNANNRPTAKDLVGAAWQASVNVTTAESGYWGLSPTLIAPKSGPELLVVWTEDNTNWRLRFATRTAGTWSAPAYVPSATSLDPAAMALLPSGDILLAFRGQDGFLYTITYSAGAWVGNPVRLGAVTLLGSPALATGIAGDRAELAFVGTDNNAYHMSLSATGVWSGAVSVGANVSYVSIATGP